MHKIHPRQKIVREATNEINTSLFSIIDKHGITDGEVLNILSSFLSTQAKYMIRQERHQDTNKPGGLG